MPSGDRPIRVLELRSVLGTGGGPEKTILLGAELADPSRFAVTVCYLRDVRDPVFSVDRRASDAIRYVEILERHSFDPKIWRDLRALVREGRFDVVHAHEYKSDVLAYGLSRVEGVIALATAHGWTGHTRRERVYYAVDKRLLARFPRVIAVSREIRDTLVRAGADPHKVEIVLNGIDPERFRRVREREAAARAALGVASGELVVGSVGRLEPQKRFDLLLDAFADARRSSRRSMRLLIAGAGSMRSELEAQARRLQLGTAVRILGHVEDIVGFHHALDLYVQSSDYEGTPNVILEAMSMETPIVATKVGGTEDLVHDTEHALLVSPNDASALAKAIEGILGDAEAARARALAARRRVEGELSFRTRCNRIEAIYEELVLERRRERP